MANVRPLTAPLLKTAQEELREEPERLQADLQHLRDWIAKQPHLRTQTDDQFLVAFLRGAKFSLERAKEKLDAYHTIRTALPDYFADRDPTNPISHTILKNGVFLPLGEDAEGRRVVVLRVGAYDAAEIRMFDVFKLTMMVMDVLMLEDDHMMIKGLVIIVDLEGVTLAHATQYTPPLIKRVMTYYLDGFPLRQKGINYINTLPGFEAIFNIFMSFMKEKLKRRITIHKDLESLYNNVPKEILPKEYGGNASSIQEIVDHWTTKMVSMRQHFLDETKFGVDESKRPGTPKSHADLFGLEGSFRTLNVD